MSISKERRLELYRINPEKYRISSRKYHNANRDLVNQRDKKRRENLKIKVISHYSGGTMACKCCGEKTPEFLTMDHINNNGTLDRKQSNGGGHHNYRVIIKNNFPDGYQVLCYNCNCGRARTEDKICPHKKG